jgi:phospholipid/cholesterol/gamma-HCH transport system permease protein
MHSSMGPASADRPWSVAGSEGCVRLSGRLCTADAAELVAAVRDATRGAGSVRIDFDGTEQLDGGVIALLRADLATRGIQTDLRGGDRFRPLLRLYESGESGASAPAPKQQTTPHRFLAEVGRSAAQELGGIIDYVGFLGELTVAVGRVARHPRARYVRAIPGLLERTGADAIPIVLVINFLLGLVVAYMSARELRVFAANLYVADLIGIAMARQLGPLMTAIILSGRSGAAFATELGSMKVSEEIDALRTLGLEPFGWLVLPRVLTLVIVLPILTMLAEVIGIMGGLVIGVASLDLTPQRYFKEVSDSLAWFDVWSGLVMSIAFAIAIGTIACQQGFAASGGPLGVGQRTTRTVVSSIFAIVLIDSAFTVVFHVVGLG